MTDAELFIHESSFVWHTSGSEVARGLGIDLYETSALWFNSREGTFYGSASNNLAKILCFREVTVSTTSGIVGATSPIKEVAPISLTKIEQSTSLNTYFWDLNRVEIVPEGHSPIMPASFMYLGTWNDAKDYFLEMQTVTQIEARDKCNQVGMELAAFQVWEEIIWLDGVINVTPRWKGINTWDEFVHRNSNKIIDRSTGDIAADSYHAYHEDVSLLKFFAADVYRFSLSWSRILPTGRIDYINPAGIQHYNNLINLLIANGIEPIVTLHHWDLPQPLMEIGGWPNEEVIHHFTNFAHLAFRLFGDRVRKWIIAPGHTNPDEAKKCVHNVIKAHARVYHLYDRVFRPNQGGKMGIGLLAIWHEAKNPGNSGQDRLADYVTDMTYGSFAHPIVFGTYPPGYLDFMEKLCRNLGVASPRLDFTLPESAEIRDKPLAPPPTPSTGANRGRWRRFHILAPKMSRPPSVGRLCILMPFAYIGVPYEFTGTLKWFDAMAPFATATPTQRWKSTKKAVFVYFNLDSSTHLKFSNFLDIPLVMNYSKKLKISKMLRLRLDMTTQLKQSSADIMDIGGWRVEGEILARISDIWRLEGETLGWILEDGGWRARFWPGNGYISGYLEVFTRYPPSSELKYMKTGRTSDYLGVNYYTTRLVEIAAPNKTGDVFGFVGIKLSADPQWVPVSLHGNSVTPRGFRKMLSWVKMRYGNPEIYVLENGYGGWPDGLEDYGRISFHRDYINEMLKSVILDGVNVRMYVAWSLLDGFDWYLQQNGYSINFGVVAVNFTDPGRRRTPKMSAYCLKQIFLENGFPNNSD
ncbi:Lactase-phlorizin hydrolase [Folsomia candida]|uniref:Lactase-phlorizin hydrolase n=1 Tax=Folsomia candida TaxID=158441 RepID=A0A226DNU0_FOLCA|nr:Lactase-phlorizin hydrolase [Folsomia candida]